MPNKYATQKYINKRKSRKVRKSKKYHNKSRRVRKSMNAKKSRKSRKPKTSKKHNRRVKKRLHIMKGGDDTAGHEAAAAGNIEGVQKHINSGEDVDVNEQDEMGETMLYIALENKHDDIAEMLLSRGASITMPINGSDLIELTAEQPNMFSDKGFNMVYDKALKIKRIDQKTYDKYYRV